MKVKNKIISLLLCACMIIPMLSLQAQATDYVSVTTEAELKQALTDEKTDIAVNGDITIQSAITIPSGTTLTIASSKHLYNRSSITNAEGGMIINNHIITNYDDGTLINNGTFNNTDVANNSVESFELTGAALTLFKSFYTGNTPNQADVFFRISVDGGWAYPAQSQDRYQFAQAAGDLNPVRSLTINTVPEPSAALLGLIGTLGLLRRRR